MNQFAPGMSLKLVMLALEHRPAFSHMSRDMIQEVARLAGFGVSGLDSAYIYVDHPDGHHKLCYGLMVAWQAQVKDATLEYSPYVKAFSTHGSDKKILEDMEKRLSSLLPEVGYSPTFTVRLPEPTIHVPAELFQPKDGINVMLLSEFRQKYESLYQFLKQVF